MHPLFSSHIVPDPSLRTIPMIFLVDSSSFSQLFQAPYLGVDVSMDDMTILPQTAVNYHIFDLHKNTHPIPKNIS